MIVMKFGGSSLRDASRITEVINIIKGYLAEQPIIVCSATGSTTNDLIAAGEAALKGDADITSIKNSHEKIATDLGLDSSILTPLFDEAEALLKSIAMLHELSDATMDHLVSFGERLSVRLMAATLTKTGIEAKSFDAFDIGFLTDSRFGNAELQKESYSKIASTLGSQIKGYPFTPVVTGFIAKDKDGRITTLGRSGSDLTASVLGAALKVKEIQVWKDVDGLLTTDPRIVKNAHKVSHISFIEASELAYFGAKVLHPLSIQPAMAHGIPVRVKNSYNPTHPGTLITAETHPATSLVKAITCKHDITLVDVTSSRMIGQSGFLARIFNIFKEHKISIDMLASSEISVSLTLDPHYDIKEALPELAEIALTAVSNKKAIISLIGDVSRSNEILKIASSTLHDHGIAVQMISQGASKVNIGLVINDEQANEAIQALHAAFFDNTTEEAA